MSVYHFSFLVSPSRDAPLTFPFPFSLSLPFFIRQVDLIDLINSLAKAKSDLKDRQTKLRKSEGDLAAFRTELEAETRTLDERTEGAVRSTDLFPSSISRTVDSS